ncbi:MAG: hypothetical protein WCO20_07690, partial [Holophagaceae bacterium]
MSLQLALTLFTFLAAGFAAWAALRPRRDAGLDDLARTLTEEIARARRDSQADLNVQLGPLRDKLAGLDRAVATAKEEQLKGLALGLA